MTTDRHVRIVTRRALVAGAAATLLAPPLSAEDLAAGKVESLRGGAFAQGSDARRPLQPAADLFVSDLIETEASSSLIMRLGKATTVSSARWRDSASTASSSTPAARSISSRVRWWSTAVTPPRKKICRSARRLA